MTVQGLWEANYEILSIIFLNEFTKLNVNMDTIIKKRETCGTLCKVCYCFLEYISSNYGLIEYKCLCSNKNYQQNFDKELNERFFNIYKFSNHDDKKFILLLQKGVYPYEYMDNWEKFHETWLPEKKFLQSLTYGKYY